jgi:hypothetical protein
MKTRKILSALIIVAFGACLTSLNAQTFQKDLTAQIHDMNVFCLEKSLSGFWIYHISYHIDKKTSEVSRIHWNIKDAYLYDTSMPEGKGNSYKVIDTGADGNGYFYWWLWDNINAYNEPYCDEDHWIEYDIVDNWMPLPAVLPVEGVFTGTFKFIGNGEKVTFKEVTKYRIDANGEVTMVSQKMDADCNW